MKGCGKIKFEKCRFDLMVNKNYFSFGTLHTIFYNTTTILLVIILELSV